jgi:hypothetical protein
MPISNQKKTKGNFPSGLNSNWRSKRSTPSDPSQTPTPTRADLDDDDNDDNDNSSDFPSTLTGYNGKVRQNDVHFICSDQPLQSRIRTVVNPVHQH